MDKLLDPLIRFAQEMLEKHGEFYPFGMQMTSVGEVTMAAAYTGTEHPSSQELIDLLHEGMRRHADDGGIRAAGICYDVRIHSAGGEGVTDAIAADLDHRDGDPVTIYVPYKKRRFGRIEYGELVAEAGQRPVFA